MTGLSDGYALFFLACGIGFFVMGWLEILGGKVYGRNTEEYTPESVRRFSRVDGIICVCVGLTAAVSQLARLYGVYPEAFRLIGLVTVVIGIILDLRLSERILKRR